MQSEFIDRVLTCVDCHSQFVFTAGEQIFFLDKQFKNDPKRCKPCKAKRQSLGGVKSGAASAMSRSARTETRTECSECHIETTVPFRPTQGRPVLCRQCFQSKRAPNGVGRVGEIAVSVTAYTLTEPVETFSEELVQPLA